MKIRIVHLFALAVMYSAFYCQAAEEEKYTLRYKFQPGEVIRWNVVHRTMVRTAVSKSDQTSETTSESEKVWRVKEVKPDGVAVFDQLVPWVDMRQKLPGTNDVRYNSRTDIKPPPGFEDIAAAVGVPLSLITMDDRGKIIARKRSDLKGAAINEGPITIPLPEEPIAVGHVWNLPCDVDVPLESGGVKKFKALQQFKLESVKTGVASIRVTTQFITPITDPAIEAKVAQHESTGIVRLDIDAGRIIGQQTDVDKHVVGFRGPTSSLHYLARFSEQLIPETAKTAEKSVGVLK